MKVTEPYRVEHYSDKLKGKNYGLIPVRVEGMRLKDKFENSDKWRLVKKEDSIDERNDNQCDIHRGSDLVYQNIETENIVEVSMDRSRSGKTINWQFRYYFEEQVEF